MDHIVVDVEIQKCVEDTPGGWNATDKLGVAVACVWEYKTQRMRVYGPDDIDLLRERLFGAERISGYNIFNFDFPVIWGVQKNHWMGNCTDMDQNAVIELHDGIKPLLLKRTDDMLRRIWQANGLDPDRFNPRTHGGTKLDDVAYHTLGVRKIGNGADAPKWYQQGKIQQVVNYCADDVAIERDLTDFVDRYGYVVLPSGEKLPIPQWRGS